VKRAAAWDLLLLALLAVLLFHEVLGGRVLFARDLQAGAYPAAASFVRGLEEGSWPLWDPYIGFGQPRLANPESQIFYPFTWLSLVLAPWTRHAVLVLTHLPLSGLGACLLARALGARRAASLLAGGAWMASGPLLSLVSHVHHFTGAAWMPWVVLAAERTLRSRALPDALLWGAAAAAQVLAGSGDMCLLTGIACAAVLVAHLARRAPAWPRQLGLTALAALVAVGLSAAQWLPTAEVTARSERRSLPEFMRTFWSVHPVELVQAVAPVPLYALPLAPALRSRVFESREPLLVSLYLGLPVAVLALAGLARPREIWKWGVLSALFVLAVLVALGRHAPFYDAAVALIPPLRLLRYPAKLMVLAALAASQLAASFLDSWIEDEGRPAPRGWTVSLAAGGLLVGVVAVLLGLATTGAAVTARWLALPPGLPAHVALAPLAWMLLPPLLAGLALLALAARRARGAAPRWTGAAVVALALGELAWSNRALNPTAPSALLRYRPPTVEAAAQGDLSRLYVYDYASVAGKAAEHLGAPSPEALGFREGSTMPFASILALRTYLYPPVGETWGVYGSFDVDQRGLYDGRLARFVLLLRAVEGTPAHDRLLRLGAVGRVFALHASTFAACLPVAEFETSWRMPIQVFAVPSPLPRAYAVDGVRVAEGDATLAALLDPSFEPARAVVLEDGEARPSDPAFVGKASIRVLAQDHVTIAAEMSGPGRVVLVDAYDPGWRATVDGAPALVERANGAFRAVEVGAGTHVVEMRYRPWPVPVGLALSLLAVVVIVAGAAAGGRLSRRPSPDASRSRRGAAGGPPAGPA